MLTGSLTCSFPAKEPIRRRVFLGNGDGSFKTTITAREVRPWAFVSDAIGSGEFNSAFFDAGQDIRSGQLADLNKDGILDIVSASGGTVFVGNGDGSFKAALSFSTLEAARTTVVGDFNNDGNLDAFTTSDSLYCKRPLSRERGRFF